MTSATLVRPAPEIQSLPLFSASFGGHLNPNSSLPRMVKEYTRALIGQTPSNASSTAGIAEASIRVSALSGPHARFPLNVPLDFMEEDGYRLQAIFDAGPPDWVLQLRAELEL